MITKLEELVHRMDGSAPLSCGRAESLILLCVFRKLIRSSKERGAAVHAFFVSVDELSLDERIFHQSHNSVVGHLFRRGRWVRDVSRIRVCVIFVNLVRASSRNGVPGIGVVSSELAD
jgi:hypothetical protein